MNPPFEVMIAAPDLERRQRLSEILVQQGFDPICVSNLKQCHQALASTRVTLVFCDARLPDGKYGDLIAAYRQAGQRPRVVLISPDAGWDEFREAMRQGVSDVIGWPCRPTDVEWMVIRAKRDELSRSKDAASAFAKRSELERRDSAT